jgi:hypothetical protein
MLSLECWLPIAHNLVRIAGKLSGQSDWDGCNIFPLVFSTNLTLTPST